LDEIKYDAKDEDECYPAFMAIDVPPPRGPIFVFGEYFLRKYYTVFDRDNNVIGLSVANHLGNLNNKKLNIETPYDDYHGENKIKKTIHKQSFQKQNKENIIDPFKLFEKKN